MKAVDSYNKHKEEVQSKSQPQSYRNSQTQLNSNFNPNVQAIPRPDNNFSGFSQEANNLDKFNSGNMGFNMKNNPLPTNAPINMNDQKVRKDI